MSENTDKLIDDLMSGLTTKLTSRFKDTGYNPVYRLDDPSAPINCNNFLSTNSTALDISIANKADGGIPVGRITEIAGLEGTGKSLMCAHLIANTQKQGGIGVYIDTETAIFTEYFIAVGVDVNKMLYINVRPIESILQGIEDTIVEVRKTSPDIPLTIIVDSYAGATAKGKNEEGYEKVGYNTDKALIMSDRLGKIADMVGKNNVTLVFTNQLRTKMGAMPFQDPWCVDPITTKVKIRHKI